MAKNAIRYYSKFGHTKKMVEAVKDIVGAEPQLVSVPLWEHREEVEDIMQSLEGATIKNK